MTQERLEEAKRLYETANADQRYVLESLFPELQKSEDERIRRNIKIALMSMEENLTDFYSTHHTSQKELLAWLEKQGTERKQLYVRFGDIPSNEKSKIYRGEEKIGDENGVSVYPAFESNGDIVLGLTLPITRSTLYTQQHLLEYDNRPCYLVSGDCVGKGADGEPLIRNISIIKRLDNYRIKETEKQGSVDKASSEIAEKNVNEETNTPTAYGKYVDECLNDAAKHFFSEGEDKYSVADLFYAGVRCGKSWLEKQGEQKPADKVEPKLEIGDWVIYNSGNTYQVEEISDKRYELIDNFGDNLSVPMCWEKSLRLWTIQDAKDGDVLAIGNEYFLFKGKKEGTASVYISHCFTDSAGTFRVTNGVDCGEFFPIENGIKVHPATKAQCEFLFSKMKEAGYEWDTEKKELKKIEKGNSPLLSNYSNIGKNVWSEEDEKILKTLINDTEKTLFAIKQEERPDIMSGLSEIYIERLRWLKSLKNRVQPQQVWSENDKEQLDRAIYMMGQLGLTKSWDDVYNWLKSLKDRI